MVVSRYRLTTTLMTMLPGTVVSRAGCPCWRVDGSGDGRCAGHTAACNSERAHTEGAVSDQDCKACDGRKSLAQKAGKRLTSAAGTEGFGSSQAPETLRDDVREGALAVC